MSLYSSHKCILSLFIPLGIFEGDFYFAFHSYNYDTDFEKKIGLKTDKNS